MESSIIKSFTYKNYAKRAITDNTFLIIRTIP